MPVVELGSGKTVLNIGSGNGSVNLFAGMMHPWDKADGIELVDFSFIVTIFTKELTRHFLNLSKRVQLVNGDFLGPDNNSEILFASLAIVFMLDNCFEKSVHQKLVEGLLS